MITGPDLTPEQRQTIFRSYRFSAITNAIYGVVLLGLAAFEFAVGRRSTYVWASLLFGAAMFAASWLSWSRAKRYQG